MSEVKTVRIVCDWRADGWVAINESDFNSEKHALWVDPAEKVAAEQAEADRAEKVAAENEKQKKGA